ncbi:DNA-directed RNA polymerases I, II, and III subunit RPABC1 [Pancytospora epiphaga]|nr:DNA-directed RNA polymerases I, II, and III subunit RPABC1 [Pancytospora epiphaga]
MRELWLARNTVIEILQHRGYPSTQRILTYAEFTSLYPTASSSPTLLNFVVSIEEPLAIHFTTDEKLPKSTLENIISSYSSQNIQHFLLITPSKLNPSCKALANSSKLKIEHFLLQELQFNVLKHELVPPHRILKKEEAQVLLKKLRTDISNLPILLTSDIVCRYIGGVSNDIVEIARNSLTTGKSLYYRAVKSV